MQIVEQTEKERVKMYMKLPKKKIIEMLIECNNIIYGIANEKSHKNNVYGIDSSIHRSYNF